MKLLEPQLQAEIYYLTENEGGRKSAVKSGYRGQFHYNGKDWDAPQEFIDKEICELGETVKVNIQTLSTDFHVGKFKVNQEFETREGNKVVGKGKITKILREDFNYWDGKIFLSSIDKKIKPYSDYDDLLGFKIDFEGWLNETEIIREIEFEMTGNLECMILVKCKLIAENIQPRDVAFKIIECWKTRLATSNHLYKIEMENKFNQRKNQLEIEKMVLSFATWHSIYLTGQIIVTQ
ncbi:hypothetical protein ACFSX9_02640 [Flavobacterium ardleyense]|uniref:Translation elongation factor EFTu/EF1A C-terminal domain-containing protein n=1 Tax=Flavobacterium ardleyense TaxID=2038737 RepID=A0ABW5Z468_9FLAO